MQRELRCQVHMKRLEEEEVEGFRRVLAEELGDGLTGGGGKCGSLSRRL